jgi:hypothetical protein
MEQTADAKGKRTMKQMHQRTLSWLLPAAVILLLLAGCAGGPEATPLPTRTPAPTFTPTLPADAVQPVTDAGQPQAPAGDQQAATEQPAAEQPAAEQPAADQAPTDTPTPEPSPTPAVAQAVLTTQANIRSGPGTEYSLLGTSNPGDQFRITGKNPAGTWWEIDYNGRTGWVFGELVAVTGGEGVAVAANIPAAPVVPTAPPPPPAAPTNTPAPAEPAPTPAPARPTYRFNVAVVSKCLPQEGGNWFEGRTYVNGQPQSGHKVVFSYAPDGPPATSPVQSGPHEGYPGWDAGYYSHIISANGPREGNWYAWIVDDNGARISELANWQFNGPGGACNQVVVDFDSR